MSHGTRKILGGGFGRIIGVTPSHDDGHTTRVSCRAARGAQGPRGYEKIYAVVRRIPRGRVATYGQVAALAGLPGRARQVGYAMYALPRGSRVPWQRVINAAGGISRRRVPGAELTQGMLLEREGVRFGPGARISLARYGWSPSRR